MATEKYQLTKDQERSTPRFAIAVIALLILSMIALVVIQGLKAPDSSTQAGSIDFTQTTGELTPGQDMVITVENFTVVVPKDATALAGSVSIIPREPNLFPFAGAAEWTRPQVINVEYRNGLGTAQPNVTFTKPVLICFKLTPELWLDYNQRPSEYQVQYYDETQHPAKWAALPTTAYPENMHLCGQVDHLSLFALAIKVKANIPVTGATPTAPGIYVP